VPETEAEEALLVLEDYREALGRMRPLEEDDPVVEVPEDSSGSEPPETGHLQAVPPVGDGPPVPEQGAASGDRPMELVPLCSVRDLAEGKMLEGVLRSQELHPVLAEESPGVLPGKLKGLPHGEIRMPANEILEARAVLEDFRRAVERSQRERPSSEE
jgi:hypothetical protein